MHIPNGFLDPKTSAGLMAAGATLLVMAWSKVKERVKDFYLEPMLAGVNKNFKSGMRVLSLYGQNFLSKYSLLTALVFSGQMFNFPIASGTSGHLLGGVLLALFLGPWGGTLALALVLVIQAVFYGDGGLMALGANIINMAGAGCVVSYYVYKGLNSLFENNYSSLFVAAWFSVVLAAILCSVELAVSGTGNLMETLLAMCKVHALIGVGEGLLTLAAVIYLTKIVGWEFYGEKK